MHNRFFRFLLPLGIALVHPVCSRRRSMDAACRIGRMRAACGMRLYAGRKRWSPQGRMRQGSRRLGDETAGKVGNPAHCVIRTARKVGDIVMDEGVRRYAELCVLFGTLQEALELRAAVMHVDMVFDTRAVVAVRYRRMQQHEGEGQHAQLGYGYPPFHGAKIRIISLQAACNICPVRAFRIRPGLSPPFCFEFREKVVILSD